MAGGRPTTRAHHAAAADALIGPEDGCGQPRLTAELALARAGRRLVAGVDEVGRGALAGPLVAAAVVLPRVVDEPSAAALAEVLDGVRDSKLLLPAKRERLACLVRTLAAGVGVAVVPEAVIDVLGIGRANRLALMTALEQLPDQPDFVLVDAVRLPELPCEHIAVVRGDSRCLSIAAASIVAKVTRDALLSHVAPRFPQYGFEQHKGYGTAAHLAALNCYGPCLLHRRSFAPVCRMVAGVLPAACQA